MKWKIIDRSLQYQGFFQLECVLLQHRLYDGGWSKILQRELFQRSDAVAVLPYDPVFDQLLLIEQFRMGAIESNQGPWLTEIIAGLIKPGERREDVARREAFEEAGCELLDLRHVCEYYSSPGGLSERVSIYIAKAELENHVDGVHGLREEGEDIRVSKVSAQAAFEMVAANIIDSAMPIIALQWLQINHERMRALWR
jgi:ADP-ribose pyrophosphatase